MVATVALISTSLKACPYTSGYWISLCTLNSTTCLISKNTVPWVSLPFSAGITQGTVFVCFCKKKEMELRVHYLSVLVYQSSTPSLCNKPWILDLEFHLFSLKQLYTLNSTPCRCKCNSLQLSYTPKVVLLLGMPSKPPDQSFHSNMEHYITIMELFHAGGMDMCCYLCECITEILGKRWGKWNGRSWMTKDWSTS